MSFVWMIVILAAVAGGDQVSASSIKPIKTIVRIMGRLLDRDVVDFVYTNILFAG